MPKGDIVLIAFPFTDLSGSKLRLAVVLVQSIPDITVCFITTQAEFQDPTDILLTPDQTNGLRKASIIRINKIATLDSALAKGLLGKLTANEISDLN